MELHEIYAGSRAAVAQLATALTPEEEQLPVPACPGWRARDVVVHLVGVAEDNLTGNMANAPAPEWTGAHLDRRRDTPLADAVAEWEKLAPELEGSLAGMGFAGYACTLDVVTHRHDLLGALGWPAPAVTPAAEGFDAAALDFAIGAFGKAFGKRVHEAGLASVRFAHDGWSFQAGKAGTDLVVPVLPVEFFRALTGRRSVGQVSAWGWPVDPAPYLPLFSVFGPLPQADVAESFAR